MISVQIALDRDVVPAAGEISGRAILTAEAPWTARWAQLVLCWRAANERNTREEEVCVIPVAQPGEELPPRVERPFTLQAPNYPRSFQGTHVRVEWHLQVDVRPTSGKVDSPQEVPLAIVSPAALETTG